MLSEGPSLRSVISIDEDQSSRMEKVSLNAPNTAGAPVTPPTANTEKCTESIGSKSVHEPEKKSAEVAGMSYPRELFLKSFLRNQDDDWVRKVCNVFHAGAFSGFLLWISLLVAVFTFAPSRYYEEPHGIEQRTHYTTFVILFVSNGSRFIPFIVRDKSLDFFRNGVFVAILVVQLIAMTSNLYMGGFATPIVIDQVTGLRVNLIRWVEFTPLCFIMSFLLDNMGSPLTSNPPKKWNLAISLGLSTICGAILPFCRNGTEWLVVFTISWVLFVPLFFHLRTASAQYYSMKAELLSSSGATTLSADTDELYQMARVKFYLTCICTITWTSLALLYSLIAAAPLYAASDSWLASPYLQNVAMSGFDVFSKVWYLSGIIDAYENVFDESARAIRRLEEMRHFMTAIWESSSDVIIFASKKKDRIHARISPSFFRMIGREMFDTRKNVSLILEIHEEKKTFYTFAIDLSKPITRDQASQYRKAHAKGTKSFVNMEGKSLEEHNIALIAQVAINACANYKGRGKEHSFVQNLLSEANEVVKPVHCEAKVADFERGSCLIVLRNISDRVQRFEAEKSLLRESTIRRKDAEANQFTRHEIKNGILAAIGILDHLRESPPVESIGSFTDLNDMDSSNTSNMLDQLTVPGSDGFDELESTLRDILDTILYETMAREIIYGEYQPRKERLAVPAVLASLQHGTSKRFPFKFQPTPFPKIYLDRQLLRYIYRNAVSNACRYGKNDGIVKTCTTYNRAESKFLMEVINEPGPGHSELVELSRPEVLEVFEAGFQLSITRAAQSEHAETTKNESQGSGAWIMQKCAEALGGKCDIRFEPERTVFTFWCPTRTSDRDAEGKVQKSRPFRLPQNVWGIAVDDSKVQRKLLDHFMKIAGIEKERRVVLGATDDEIENFGDRIKELILANPDDKFLAIVDENLDLGYGYGRQQTVSGSITVEQLREELDEEPESRLLALIRSANDSTTDVERYKSRAHGFMPKEPIKKNEVLNVIKPWWHARFPAEAQDYKDKYVDDISMDDMEYYGPSPDDIEESLRIIDALCSVAKLNVIKSRWRIIRDKLHALTGDLKTMSTGRDMHELVAQIAALWGKKAVPDGFREEWKDLRTRIHDQLLFL